MIGVGGGKCVEVLSGFVPVTTKEEEAVGEGGKHLVRVVGGRMKKIECLLYSLEV